MTFDGFPPETLRFLSNLTKQNNKTWFDAHRHEYDNFYMAPARQFVSAIEQHLKKMEPNTTADPRVNKSIFRINRDIRFSKDKTPYKNHIDLWFYNGEKRKPGSSGFFFRLLSDGLVLGAGIHGFDKDGVQHYRKAVDTDVSGEKLAGIIKQIKSQGYGIGGLHYKTVPRSYDAAHARGELLKHKSMYAYLEAELPSEIHQPAFVDWCTSHFKNLRPLHRWLIENL